MYVEWLSNFKEVVFKDIYFTKPMGVVLVVVVLVFIFMLRSYKRFGVLVFLSVGILFALTVVHENLQASQKSELVIFHKHKSSVIGIKSKGELHVFTTDTTLSATTYLIQNYNLLNAIHSTEIRQMQNALVFGNKKLLVVDSLGVYSDSSNERLLLLSQSPDIHFEKLLKTQNISGIIADGSNYRSYVERWQKTAAQYNIPFHSTYNQGCYTTNCN